MVEKPSTETDSNTSLTELKSRVKAFCDARDWDKFHNAKELSMALNVESSELVELFLWKTHAEVDEMFKNTKREKIEEEIADVFYYLLRLSQRYNLDLTQMLTNKMKQNNAKYPVEKAKGNHKKYNEL